jgi:DNA primase
MKAEKLLDEIKSRIDIVEFISDYVQLKKAGQNYKGLCPFHSEKTPSFMASQAKQIFHCFGCGAGGDVVTFLMKHENLSFIEALRYLAKKTGIRITDPTFEKAHSEKRGQLLQINEEAMKFFIKNLHGSRKAMDYLAHRGLNEDSVKKFRLGYAAGKRDDLAQYLKKMGFSNSLLADTGLVVTDGKGCRDWFRERIMFPIFNLKNDVIAFGGRVMDNSLPKYINSPETEVFKKGETLFAINFSKDEIRKKGYALIVEGYLDAIICHQYGFGNAVAPLGTALTSRHLVRLKPLTGRTVLVFDGDQAGISAARRSLAILCENDFKAKVLVLPTGEDPDSFLRKNGSQPFKTSLTHAVSAIKFLLQTAKGERTDSVREALGMIASVKDLLIAEEMLRELAERSGINESVLRSELEKTRKKALIRRPQGLRPSAARSHREEYLLLSAVIAFPEKTGEVFARLDIEDLHDETVRSVFRKIKTLGDRVNTPSLLDTADDAERTLITGLSIEPGFDPEHVDRNIDDCLQKLGQRKLERERRLAEESGDILRLDSLLKEKRKSIKGASI